MAIRSFFTYQRSQNQSERLPFFNCKTDRSFCVDDKMQRLFNLIPKENGRKILRVYGEWICYEANWSWKTPFCREFVSLRQTLSEGKEEFCQITGLPEEVEYTHLQVWNFITQLAMEYLAHPPPPIRRNVEPQALAPNDPAEEQNLERQELLEPEPLLNAPNLEQNNAAEVEDDVGDRAQDRNAVDPNAVLDLQAMLMDRENKLRQLREEVSTEKRKNRDLEIENAENLLKMDRLKVDFNAKIQLEKGKIEQKIRENILLKRELNQFRDESDLKDIYKKELDVIKIQNKMIRKELFNKNRKISEIEQENKKELKKANDLNGKIEKENHILMELKNQELFSLKESKNKALQETENELRKTENELRKQKNIYERQLQEKNIYAQNKEEKIKELKQEMERLTQKKSVLSMEDVVTSHSYNEPNRGSGVRMETQIWQNECRTSEDEDEYEEYSIVTTTPRLWRENEFENTVSRSVTPRSTILSKEVETFFKKQAEEVEEYQNKEKDKEKDKIELLETILIQKDKEINRLAKENGNNSELKPVFLNIKIEEENYADFEIKIEIQEEKIKELQSRISDLLKSQREKTEELQLRISELENENIKLNRIAASNFIAYSKEAIDLIDAKKIINKDLSDYREKYDKQIELIENSELDKSNWNRHFRDMKFNFKESNKEMDRLQGRIEELELDKQKLEKTVERLEVQLHLLKKEEKAVQENKPKINEQKDKKPLVKEIEKNV